MRPVLVHAPPAPRHRLDTPTRDASAPPDGELEHALLEVRAAILLVAGGRCPRVVVTNLASCEKAAAMLDSAATALRVRLQVRTRENGAGSELIVSGD